MTDSRGVRNNNPGNIRLRAGVHWDGQVPEDAQSDLSFVQFTAPQYGIRAIARILTHYQAIGINTIQACINRWAPPGENDTTAYVNAVSAACHVSQTDIIDIPSIMLLLIKAIIWHENGECPYSDDLIQAGIDLAKEQT